MALPLRDMLIFVLWLRLVLGPPLDILLSFLSSLRGVDLSDYMAKLEIERYPLPDLNPIEEFFGKEECLYHGAAWRS